MLIMNSMINDIFRRLCVEGSRIVREKEEKVLSNKELYVSVRQVLPGELAEVAARKAWKAYEDFYGEIVRFYLESVKE